MDILLFGANFAVYNTYRLGMRVITLSLSPRYQLFSEATLRKIVGTEGTITVLLPEYQVYKCFIILNNCWIQNFIWRPFTQFYSTGVARVPMVVSGAFYYRLDVCNLCKLLFQTQFLSNYPTIIIFYLHSNIPQVNNKCIISYNHLLTCF